MTNSLYEELLWLPPIPADFSKRLERADTLQELQELAKHRVDESQLNKLARKLKALLQQATPAAPLATMRLGVISNANTQLIAPALIGTALRYGICLEVIEAEFNQVAQEAFSEQSAFAGGTLDVSLLCLDHRGLPLVPSPGNKAAANACLDSCFSYISSVVSAIRKKTHADVILQNIAPQDERIAGSFETRLAGTMSWLITRLNTQIADAGLDDALILDIAGLAATVGLGDWHDPTAWNVAKLPFAPIFIPIYADYVCRILAAKIGKNRRCLILDLDNTLWGGVIGDDGLEGIVLGNGDPTGEAHLAIQRAALELRDRGIVLAVCSKNEDISARQPFQSHPEMLLKEDDIAVFQANWHDKASNIRAIAEALSLGLDSCVFLDDNPAERMQVRRELPEVAVPELPDDPAYFAKTLLAAGYFDAIKFSEEDRQRSAFYRDNARRAEISSQYSDLNGYLAALNMEITIAPFDATGRTRIAQLIAKSNQFNLTTKRYSQNEVQELQENPDYLTLQIRLKDALGDNGMISVVICKKNSDVWEIDTWLMSCRVLGRRVEEAVLQHLVSAAGAAGAKQILGTFIATPRNMIVKDHYKKLGFTAAARGASQQTWILNIADYQPASLPMKFVNAV
jgi:FkbH-like protein